MITAMYSRNQKPWHGIGFTGDVNSAEEALEKGGLNFNVTNCDVYVNDQKVSGWKANVRQDTQDVFGIVSTRYKIIQNKDAFAFVNALLDMGARIETAGCIDNGKTSWILTQLEPFTILDDAFENYLFFVNSFDGKNAIKVGRTDVRIVCENTLNLALKTASRLWSLKHMGTNLEAKLLEASKVLQLNNAFTSALQQEAEQLAIATVSENDIAKFADHLFAIPDDASKCVIERKTADKDIFFQALNAPDLANFKSTKWGLLQAVSDIAYHTEPKRKTSSYQETKISYAINGHPLLEKAYEFIQMI